VWWSNSDSANSNDWIPPEPTIVFVLHTIQEIESVIFFIEILNNVSTQKHRDNTNATDDGETVIFKTKRITRLRTRKQLSEEQMTSTPEYKYLLQVIKIVLTVFEKKLAEFLSTPSIEAVFLIINKFN
jgi:hypothetical protein